MTGLNEIRSVFLNYFGKNNHEIVNSAPLVPQDDPTLLFVNAGMVPFKNCFTGIEKRSYAKATSSQKCVRAGGKHNDLDNVGYTARHHTFFEMLGNFSFGDYFKEEAIFHAWTLITEEFKLPKEKLLVTVYHTDDEAANLWKKIAGLTDDKIIRIATSDNFWSMGDTGPCGPCSEIFYDHGNHIAGGVPGSANEDGDRFIEIWNLVFMQFEQKADGSRINLPKPSIDTGMGLERFAAILQGKHDNYDTDVMRTLIENCAFLTKKNADGAFQASHRIIADHLRASGFLIADGVLPSNEGRGYVLRRIMRRAMRHAHILGASEPLMYRLVPALVEQMGEHYQELKRAKSAIIESLRQEEEAFRHTLARGLKLLEEELSNVNNKIFSGDIAFKLYDTYGFPLDLTQDILRSHSMNVDLVAFNHAMNEQKQRARASWSGSGEVATDALWFDLKAKLPATEFYYDREHNEGKVLAIVQNSILTDKIDAGQVGFIITDKTSFYAESGGQIGDKGIIYNNHFKAIVHDTQKKAGTLFVHEIEVIEGNISINDMINLNVDTVRRNKIKSNHSATHLLHESLRSILGDHITQKGSLNDDERLRFDFSHHKAMTKQELLAVEKIVNQQIRVNQPVETREMTPDNAMKSGALALFGEKYGENVRVLFMGNKLESKTYFSIELCGGTHIKNTGDIGLFKILSETGVSSGVRRIEAITGEKALDYVNEQLQIGQSIADMFKTSLNECQPRIQNIIEERKKLEKQVNDLRKQIAIGGQHTNEYNTLEKIGDITFVARILNDIAAKDLAGLVDQEKQRMEAGVIVFIAVNDNKVALAIGVTNDLINKISAVDLVRIASPIVGGKGGGGRADFAQAGGTNADAAGDAIEAIKKAL